MRTPSRCFWGAACALLVTTAACGDTGGGRAGGTDGGGLTSQGGSAGGSSATGSATGGAGTQGGGGSGGSGGTAASSGTGGGSGDTGNTTLPKFDLGDSTGGTAGATCDELMFQAMAERPDIVFVLDKSGSMDFNTWLFMGQNVNRWKSLYLTVESVLTQFEDQADFGAELFPKNNANSGECNADNPVTAPVAVMNAANILGTIPGPNASVAGNTPMGSGVQVALAHLAAIKQPTKPQAMILVADGGVSTSCGSPNSSGEVVSMVSQAWTGGLPTYVVGIDADTQSLVDQLNQIAVAGGQPLPGNEKFYNAQDGNALLAKMAEIVEGVLSCTVDLGKEPEFPGFTKVKVDGVEWPEVADCANEDGWVWSNQYDEITLCGAACQKLKDTGSMDVEFLCPQG